MNAKETQQIFDAVKERDEMIERIFTRISMLERRLGHFEKKGVPMKPGKTGADAEETQD